jgi:hypothetical protein
MDELLASSVGSFTSVLTGIVALIGLCMMAYLVNLRLDGLQYARTVNGGRKYFYNHSRLSIMMSYQYGFYHVRQHNPLTGRFAISAGSF